MKTRTTSIIAALLLSVLSSYARDLHSPDGKFAVRAEASISLIDSSGQPILTLVRNTSGDTKVEVAWSPDSRHVVVVENSHIGSGIVAAWSDGANWHKTIQMDQDQAGIVRAGQAQFHGRLVAEHRKLDGWVTPREVLVKGEMVFSNGGKCNYGYTLAFRTGEQVRLDRGGYEEGELVGTNYHLL
jgi:hypothetical protein